jgi:hypothetical protein
VFARFCRALARVRGMRIAWLMCSLVGVPGLPGPAHAQSKAGASATKQKKASGQQKKPAKKPAPQSSTKTKAKQGARPKPQPKRKPLTAKPAQDSAKKPKKAAPEKAPEVKVEVIEADEADEADDSGKLDRDERSQSDDDSEASEKTASESKRARPRSREPWLEIGVEGGALTRHFDYRGEESGALRGFYLVRAPVLAASVTVFPFASSDSAFSGLGIEGAYSRVLGVTSELGGNSYDTTASVYRTELVWNFGIGEHVLLRPKLGYRGRTLVVAGNVVPDLHEHGPRAGLEARFRVSPWLAEVEAGAQYLLSGGELTSATWFPSATGFAADARARAGVVVAQPFELLLQGAMDYASFTFAAPSEPHPNGVAAGAYDVALSLSLLARFVVR